MRRSRKSVLTVTGLIGVFIAGIAVQAGASSEGSALSGQVVDAVTHDVLDSVHVQVKGSDHRASTSSDGSFFLDKLLGDKVALQISRSGYKSREVDLLVTKEPVKWTVALWKAR